MPSDITGLAFHSDCEHTLDTSRSARETAMKRVGQQTIKRTCKEQRESFKVALLYHAGNYS